MTDKPDYSLLDRRKGPQLPIRTVADVTAWVDHIKKITWDDESAHAMEDDLHQGVLGAIAEGKADDPKGMALEALKTISIDFARWCG